LQAIQISEAEAELPQILSQVERGEPVVIMRNGAAIAHVAPGAGPASTFSRTPAEKIDPERVVQAIEGMRELRKRIGKLSLEEILSARNEGRR
jgi:antitoxin (DNA-binding transcriptional repressor) of toxin-antitoxin stability system